MKQNLLLLLGSLVLTACTSLDDFQQMDTQTRTEFVCDRDNQVHFHKRQVTKLEASLNEVKTALANGYRLVETCQTTTIENPINACTTVQENGQTVTICSQAEEPIVEEVCYETAITIDGDLEKEHEQTYLAQLATERKRVTDAYMNCFNQVGAMTPEQAFQYFQHN